MSFFMPSAFCAAATDGGRTDASWVWNVSVSGLSRVSVPATWAPPRGLADSSLPVMAWVSSGCGLTSTKVVWVSAARGDGLAEPHRVSQVRPPSSRRDEVTDPETNTWHERSPMPTPRNHAAIGTVNGKIYVIGGRVGEAFIAPSTDVSVVEEYDPAKDAWSAALARMPTERSALAAGVYNGKIYIAGGEYQDPIMMATFRVVQAFDPATNSWSTLPSLPVSRHGLAGGMIGNRFYVVGGDVQSSGTGIEASTPESEYLELPK